MAKQVTFKNLDSLKFTPTSIAVVLPCVNFNNPNHVTTVVLWNEHLSLIFLI